MPDDTRAHFSLTQAELAQWLGIHRTALAAAETGRRSLPMGHALQNARLDLATLGLLMDPTGATHPAPPPLPLPAPDPTPLQQRLKECQYRVGRLHYDLQELRKKAAPYEARLAALPILRAWTGPVKHPDREARWLNNFEQEAIYQLLYVCGAGPQRLLAARIAGLEREAELLTEAPETPPAL